MRSTPPAFVRANRFDAMAVIYRLTTLVWPLIALRFVDPTHIVMRVKGESAG
jgi:putative spermidine/putrescine transport system permease protein